MATFQQVHNYDHLSADELVSYIQQGETMAFQALVTLCNQQLYRVARSIVHHDSDAEDILQNAYIKAYTQFHSFLGKASITTWLTRIVLNESYAFLRQQKDTDSLDDVQHAQSQRPAGIILPFVSKSRLTSDPQYSLEQDRMRHLIEGVIEQLDEKHRLVFVLREVQGLSTAETAEALDISEQNVKVRLLRAKAQMKTLLQQQINSTLSESFLFMGDRCARLTQRVMHHISTLEG